jgi:hypothetical protein
VATQAFVVGHFVTQHVAFCTVKHPFQAGMRIGQVAGRQLRFCLHDEEGEENDDM